MRLGAPKGGWEVRTAQSDVEEKEGAEQQLQAHRPRSGGRWTAPSIHRKTCVASMAVRGQAMPAQPCSGISGLTSVFCPSRRI